MTEFDFDPYLKILVALLLSLPIAWDRERSSKMMGLRTFPLVAVGACAYVLIGRAFIGDTDPNALARIVAGLMTGIGFIGGGAIIKNKDQVSGTASAASIWVTGAIGAATGFGYWGYAVALSAVIFGIVFGMSRIKPAVVDNNQEKLD